MSFFFNSGMYITYSAIIRAFWFEFPCGFCFGLVTQCRHGLFSLAHDHDWMTSWADACVSRNGIVLNWTVDFLLFVCFVFCFVLGRCTFWILCVYVLGIWWTACCVRVCSSVMEVHA